MDFEGGRAALGEFITTEAPRTVHGVSDSMLRLDPLLAPAGLAHVEDFLNTYQPVTANIAAILDGNPIFRVRGFEQPEVLHAATAAFYPLFTENLLDPKIHWAWIDDERSLRVDRATRGILGYGSHIGGDLGLTIHTVKASGRFTDKQVNTYLRKDYFPKVDLVLGKTAHEVAPDLTQFQNDRIRRVFTNAVMVGIVLDRQIALRSAKKMMNASSEDEAEHVSERARQQTATVTNFILGLSYDLHTYADREKGMPIEKHSSVIDLANPTRKTAPKKVAQLIGSVLVK